MGGIRGDTAHQTALLEVPFQGVGLVSWWVEPVFQSRSRFRQFIQELQSNRDVARACD